MSELLEEIVGTDTSSLEKQQRVNTAKNDFGFFCRTYLSNYFYEEPAKYQQILYEVANTQSLSKKIAMQLKPFVAEKYQPLLKPEAKLAGAMFIEPREHGKTVRWSFAYVLWRVLTGRSRYVLIIGCSGTAAMENLQNIKTELEENEKLLSDYGNLKGKIWQDTRLELTNNSCIQSKGSGGTMRGTRYGPYRPDLIILDDILKDAEANSPTQRNKIHRWLKRTVFNLGKTSFIIWVNTIFHNDDPISRLCNELSEGTLKRWIAVRLACIRPDGKSLWPEHWPLKELNEKKESIGAAAFSTEYMNEPLSDEERIIHKEWIDTYRYELLPPASELRFFQGVDPATGAHDRTAIVNVALHVPTGTIYVLPSFAKTVSEQATVEQMVFYYNQYHPDLIGWENVVFSGIYGKYVQELAAKRHLYLPIKLLTVGGMSKEARVRSISMLIENGIIRFPVHGAENVIQELTEFPVGAFDDACDALVHAVHTAEGCGTGHVAISTITQTIKNTASSIISRARMR